jgi:serine/threonine-protein kinase
LTFISINAGSYSMGNNAISNASPEHQVTLSAFVVTRSEVTVGEYRNCVDSGACSPPQFTQTSETEKSNYQLGEENPNRPFKDEYPMNRIAWNEAVTFAEWVGGRLPTEAEWEYFATSEGTANLYAWGDDVPDCTLTIKKENDVNGCGTNGSHPVCSLSPAGDTAQGLCDVTGNLVEWTADERSSDYQSADPNGAAFIVPDPNNDPSGDRFYRMTRGGAYGSPLPVQLESRRRFSDSYFRKSPFNGFRVVKEPID